LLAGIFIDNIRLFGYVQVKARKAAIASPELGWFRAPELRPGEEVSGVKQEAVRCSWHLPEGGESFSGARICKLASLFAVLCAASSVAVAAAQAMRDPMRPADTTSSAPEAAASRLQSVLISPGRRSAIIDGAVVPLGGSVGDAKLVAVRETEVVLRRGGETEVLKLYPSVEKVAVKPRRRAVSPKETKR
jgi:MSHA biogenesis protein MshK